MTRLKLTSRATPFVIGISAATLLFLFFAFDLAHHYIPYSSNRSRDYGKLLPPFLWLAGVSAAAGMRWLRARRAKSWTCAPATIETGSISSTAGRDGLQYILRVGYWYSVNGERYGGSYTARFACESNAEATLNSLKAVPPPARYNPGDPAESILTG
ncbi:MAG TPA: hypothetical protein VMB03_23935 [Bryobacteraceae bacterium]|nr:hypothetical protein [Bryobacteraceae bacterium]